jgi:hypothetical protein
MADHFVITAIFHREVALSSLTMKRLFEPNEVV